MSSELVFVLIIVILVLGFIVDQVLDYLNLQSSNGLMPDSIKAFYDEATYLHQCRYDKEKYLISTIAESVSFAIIVVMLLSSGFAWLTEWVTAITGSEILQTFLFFGVLGLASELLNIPMNYYRTFVIEEKFGFNKTTIKIFITDLIKGWLLTIVIAAPLIAIIVLLYQYAASWFWVLAWAVVTFFSIFLSYFYTTLLVPIFNKLTPLEEGELRNSIQSVAERTGFSLKNIFVMDGSKRSSKGNAYFSGFGKKKSIVLFDTLIQEHSTEELVAILAHEIGHYKKKHIVKGLVLGVLQMGLIFYLLSLTLSSTLISNAIGVDVPRFYSSLLVFGLLLSPVTTIIGIGMNIISRKNEYEADAYAAEYYDAYALKKALIKLSVKNLSNLTPHPLYVFVHYSHPTLLQRLQALDNYISNTAIGKTQ